MAQEKERQRGQVAVGKSGGAPSLQPQTYGELIEFCRVVSESEMVPQQFRNRPGDVMVAVQMGAEVGLKPMQALQNIAVINGRPCLWGDAVVAVVENSGKLEYMKEEHEDSSDPRQNRARCEVKRHGREPVVRYFSEHDAKNAGLWSKKGPWSDYPKRMMQMRARSWAMRDAFADVLKGMSVAEEQQDVEQMRNVTDEAKATVNPENRITDDQVTDIRLILKDNEINEDALLKVANIDRLEDLSPANVKRAISWIEGMGEKRRQEQQEQEESVEGEVVNEPTEQSAE